MHNQIAIMSNPLTDLQRTIIIPTTNNGLSTCKTYLIANTWSNTKHENDRQSNRPWVLQHRTPDTKHPVLRAVSVRYQCHLYTDRDCLILTVTI